MKLNSCFLLFVHLINVEEHTSWSGTFVVFGVKLVCLSDNFPWVSFPANNHFSSSYISVHDTYLTTLRALLTWILALMCVSQEKLLWGLVCCIFFNSLIFHKHIFLLLFVLMLQLLNRISVQPANHFPRPTSTFPMLTSGAVSLQRWEAKQEWRMGLCWQCGKETCVYSFSQAVKCLTLSLNDLSEQAYEA